VLCRLMRCHAELLFFILNVVHQEFVRCDGPGGGATHTHVNDRCIFVRHCNVAAQQPLTRPLARTCLADTITSAVASAAAVSRPTLSLMLRVLSCPARLLCQARSSGG
jgi:hypothetical protein